MSVPGGFDNNPDKTTTIWVRAQDGHTYHVTEEKNGEVRVGPILPEYEDRPVVGKGQDAKTFSSPALAAAIQTAGLKAIYSIQGNETVPTQSFDELSRVAHQALQAAGVEKPASEGKTR